MTMPASRNLLIEPESEIGEHASLVHRPVHFNPEQGLKNQRAVAEVVEQHHRVGRGHGPDVLPDNFEQNLLDLSNRGAVGDSHHQAGQHDVEPEGRERFSRNG